MTPSGVNLLGLVKVTVQQILVDMTAETHRHAGHADIIRELRRHGAPDRTRGLHGVRLVTSDHHDGLKSAIAKAFIGATRVRSDATSEPTSGSLSPR